MSLDDTAVSFHVGWFGWVTDLFSERKYFLESATRLSLFGLSCLTRNLKRCPASFLQREVIILASFLTIYILFYRRNVEEIISGKKPNKSSTFGTFKTWLYLVFKPSVFNKYILIKFAKARLKLLTFSTEVTYFFGSYSDKNLRSNLSSDSFEMWFFIFMLF